MSTQDSPKQPELLHSRRVKLLRPVDVKIRSDGRRHAALRPLTIAERWKNFDLRCEQQPRKVGSKFSKGCRFWVGAFTGRGAIRYGILNWGKKRMLAHRLQYSRRNGSIKKGLVVRHLCHQPRCVEPTHLAVGTHRDNTADSVKDGRLASGDRSGSRLHPESRPRGDKHPFSCATDSRWKRCFSLYLQGRMNSREIAARLGCAQATVNVCLRGETRRHLGKINRKARDLAKRSNYLNAMRKRRVFDDKGALQLLRLRNKGMTYAEIAKRHKCSQTAVWNGIKRAKALMKAAESKTAR